MRASRTVSPFSNDPRGRSDPWGRDDVWVAVEEGMNAMLRLRSRPDISQIGNPGKLRYDCHLPCAYAGPL